MTDKEFTQSTPLPPKQPLFLSQDDIRACYDIDRNGIDRASLDSRLKLEFFVACLTNKVTHFIKSFPHHKPAGLLLNIEVLLPVFEPVDESEFMAEESNEHD